MEYEEDDIDGPNQDIIDPITGRLIAKKIARKRNSQQRQYLALSDIRKNDGLKRVTHFPISAPPVQSVSLPQNNANPLLRGRVSYAPLPSGGGSSNVPANLQNYLHPMQPQQEQPQEGYYNVNAANEDDIYQQIKQILFSMTNSNHLSNVGIVGARHPASNELGQKWIC